SCTCSGASPEVPSTSSCPSCPMSRMSYSPLAKRTASLCTLVTNGQVASMVSSPRSAAWACTAGETPWAEKITRAPSGTSSVSWTKIAPRLVRVSTTYLLCTISLRTYTGGPYSSRACSTASTARSTPAQYPRGAASRICLVGLPIAPVYEEKVLSAEQLTCCRSCCVSQPVV